MCFWEGATKRIEILEHPAGWAVQSRYPGSDDAMNSQVMQYSVVMWLFDRYADSLLLGGKAPKPPDLTARIFGGPQLLLERSEAGGFGGFAPHEEGMPESGDMRRRGQELCLAALIGIAPPE